MSRKAKPDPDLMFAQGIFDNLALPTAMLETKLHHFTLDQLAYLSTLRREVGLHYEDCPVGGQAQGTTTLSPFEDNNTASTPGEKPLHHYRPSSRPNEAVPSGGIISTSNAASALGVRDENRVLKRSEASFRGLFHDGLDSATDDLGISFECMGPDLDADWFADALWLWDDAQASALDKSSELGSMMDAGGFFTTVAQLFSPTHGV